MESSNPTLNSRVFDAARVGVGEPAMTIQGTINKTFILLAVLVACAMWAWSKAASPANAGFLGMIGMGSMIAGGIIGFVTIFKPNWSPVTAPLYAACEGLVLGFISAYFEMKYPGVVVKAVGLTFAVTLAMLLGYKAGWFQATSGLYKGILIASGGLMLFYVVVFLASLFGIHSPAFINGGGPLGIAFSLFCIGLASMYLIIDFDIIESGARQGLAKYMEWYGAFSLMMTLIWLYMEIIRLLTKLQRRN